MGGRLMLLDDEHPGTHAADRELLVTLDAHALSRDVIAEETHERLDRVGRPLGMDLSRRPHPPHDAQLARLRGHGLGVDRVAGSGAQRPVPRG